MQATPNVMVEGELACYAFEERVCLLYVCVMWLMMARLRRLQLDIYVFRHLLPCSSHSLTLLLSHSLTSLFDFVINISVILRYEVLLLIGLTNCVLGRDPSISSLLGLCIRIPHTSQHNTDLCACLVFDFSTAGEYCESSMMMCLVCLFIGCKPLLSSWTLAVALTRKDD